MRSESDRLGGSHLTLPGSHLREMKVFHMINTRKRASQARWDGVFFNEYVYVLLWNSFQI